MHGACAVATLLCPGAELAHHGTGFNRSQLVFVTEQNQAGRQRHRRQQARHQLQVNHRSLINHHQVQCQRGCGTGLHCRTHLQQLVQGLCLSGNVRLHVGRQFSKGLCDRLTQARRCLAGGGRERDEQGLAGLNGLRLQQGQQPHHGGGLASAWPSSDQGEAAARSKCAGHFLPVRFTG